MSIQFIIFIPTPGSLDPGDNSMLPTGLKTFVNDQSQAGIAKEPAYAPDYQAPTETAPVPEFRHHHRKHHNKAAAGEAPAYDEGEGKDPNTYGHGGHRRHHGKHAKDMAQTPPAMQSYDYGMEYQI